jgi:hypothetical protein
MSARNLTEIGIMLVPGRAMLPAGSPGSFSVTAAGMYGRKPVFF